MTNRITLAETDPAEPTPPAEGTESLFPDYEAQIAAAEKAKMEAVSRARLELAAIEKRRAELRRILGLSRPGPKTARKPRAPKPTERIEK